MELQGRIVRVLGETSGTNQQGSPWRKFEVIFGYYENPSDIYERHIVLSFLNDRVDSYKHLAEGMNVKVRIQLTCYERPKDSGKFFNDIRVGDVTIIGVNTAVAQQQTQQAVAQPSPTPQPAPQPQAQEGGHDDLPF